ncbi:MAG: helix-turn-helix domain-containing protein [Burkholderiales bacterium]
MKYKHLTREERYYIEQRKASQIGISINKLAKEMWRNPSSISRKLRRNFDPELGFYSGIREQSIYVERRKPQVIKKFNWVADTIRKVIFSMLQGRTSPEQICGRLKHKYGLML